MNLLHKTIMGFVVGIASPAAFATWIGPYPVTFIESGSGGIYFHLGDGTQDYSTPYPACNNTAIRFLSSLPAEELDRVFAVGLSAQATGAKVKFFVTGCNGYVTATAIAIDPTW